MRFNCHAIDVFIGEAAAGNRAGVCLLDGGFPDASVMQQVASLNGFPQTAFALQRERTHFDLRWFTPRVEDDLCGHATLATAFQLLADAHDSWPVQFSTCSGRLTVTRDGDRLALILPVWHAEPVRPAADALFSALGIEPAPVSRTRDFLVVLDSVEQVADIRPDLSALAALEPGLGGVIVTAAGGFDSDYVVRFFAPAVGIDEDPATGSACCTHAPYWADRLNKRDLSVRQLSPAGGVMKCHVASNVVRVSGRARTVGREVVDA